jgi:dipeptidyl-peptidase-4
MLTLTLLLVLSGAPATVGAAEDADVRFLRDLAETRSFQLGRPVSARPTPDGSQVLFLRGTARSPELRLHAFDVATGQSRELLTPAQVLGDAPEQLSEEEKARRERMRVSMKGFTSYQLSEDGTLVMVSLGGKVYVVPVAGGAAREVAGPEGGEAPFDPKLSPDGKVIAFVRGGELWTAPVSGGRARRLTSGATGVKTHAQAEFVAQEEMGRHTGYWWSPDSRRLVYQETDHAKVEQLYVGDPATPTAATRPFFYPRPGKANAEVTLGILPSAGGRTTWIQWDRQRYPYLTRVTWQKGSPLTIEVQTRDQRDLLLLAVDPESGKTRELLREHDETWLNLENAYRWLEDGSGFLWASERSGQWQLELRGPDGKLLRTLTPPELGFQELRHVDERNGLVMVSGSPEPIRDEIHAIPLAGGAPQPIAVGPGHRSATWAKGGTTWILQHGAVDRPTQIEVRRADGSVAGTLPSVAEPWPLTPRVEILKVGAGPGFYAALVRPRQFDPKRRYPVIVKVYGGPGSNIVSPRAESHLTNQWIADHGYIVAMVDGRGTPGRGRDWERAIHKRWADVALEDQVAGLKALAAREKAMDLGRVGIMGHSFGGFMTALAVMRRPDVYRAGVAGAPVVDWLDYDTHYTERYLGMPDPDRSVYDRNGLLPYAAGLTRPLLVAHGTADDNVHFHQTLKLADALFRANRPLELLPLSRQTHMFHQPEVTVPYWRRLFAFFQANLGRKLAAPAKASQGLDSPRVAPAASLGPFHQ